MNYEELLAELIRLRKEKGWSLVRLAKQMKSSESYVWRIENRHHTPSAPILQRWCNVLGKRYTYALEDTED